TREALSLYLSRLDDGGIIAAHISNQHIDLGPVVAGICDALGLVCIEQNFGPNIPSMAQGKLSSRWAILARRRADVGMRDVDPRWTLPGQGKNVLWTDDFSSLWPLWRRD